MAETERPLTSHALNRLRELAQGNGVDPAIITIKHTDEKHVTLTGTLMLTPQAELKTQRLVGKGNRMPKVEKSFNSFAELSSCIAEEQQKFMSNKGAWFDEVKSELDKQPGKGWGLTDARVVLDTKPDFNATAAETCPQCLGKGGLGCEYCAGRGYTPCVVCNQTGTERCYNCFGNGRNPQDQQQLCGVCSGSGFSICRTCQGRKGIPCANCHASGTLICPTCEGGGQIIELSTLSYGADLHFASGSTGELPAAMRRAIDRAGGIKALANGHATIDYVVPEDDEQPKKGAIALNYSATMECADIVVNFGNEAKRIAVFGHKRTMIEVPAFLDEALAKGVKRLHKAAKGNGKIEDALRYRAIREACDLSLAGKIRPEDLRKLYPLGLSKPMIIQITTGLRGALARMTLVARWVGFVSATVIADVLGAALYLTPLHSSIIRTAGNGVGLATEIFIPVFCAAIGYIITGQAGLFHLRRVFPSSKPALHHHGGNLAIAAALFAFIIPMALSFLAADKVLWIGLFSG